MVLQETCLNGQLDEGSLFRDRVPGSFAFVEKDDTNDD